MQITSKLIAKAMNLTQRAIELRAAAAAWPFTLQPCRGGQRRIYNLEESDAYIWISLDTCEEVDEEKAAELDEADHHDHHHDGSTTKGYRKSYYRDDYVFVQPFFTEAGAKRYIEINGHNLREPRIYVESGWRNEEWEMIRELLLAIGKVGDRRTFADVIRQAKDAEVEQTLPTLSCGHQGYMSIYPAKDGSSQCTACANKMRGVA